MLSVASHASSASNSLDVWSLVIAIVAAAISLATLIFTVGNEWWRGRRIRVSVGELSVATSLVYEVKARNVGNMSVNVVDWGFVYTNGRGPWRARRRYKPGNTGIGGPQLPKELLGAQEILLNAPADTVRGYANQGRSMKRMRAFIEITSSHRPRYSAAIKLS